MGWNMDCSFCQPQQQYTTWRIAEYEIKLKPAWLHPTTFNRDEPTLAGCSHKPVVTQSPHQSQHKFRSCMRCLATTNKKSCVLYMTFHTRLLRALTIYSYNLNLIMLRVFCSFIFFWFSIPRHDYYQHYCHLAVVKVAHISRFTHSLNNKKKEKCLQRLCAPDWIWSLLIRSRTTRSSKKKKTRHPTERMPLVGIDRSTENLHLIILHYRERKTDTNRSDPIGCYASFTFFFLSLFFGKKPKKEISFV